MDSGFRYSKRNTKPHSIHFSNVLQQNEITMKREVGGGGGGNDYLPMSEKKTIIKIMTKLSCSYIDRNNRI